MATYRWLLRFVLVARLAELCFMVKMGAARYHPGHLAVHTTRLHRYDHRGRDSMMEAEAEWHSFSTSIVQGSVRAAANMMRRNHRRHVVLKNVSALLEPETTFLQLSPKQLESLAAHHAEWERKARDRHAQSLLEGGSGKVTKMSADGGAYSTGTERKGLIDGIHDFYEHTNTIKENKPVTTPLQNLDSQYVGQIGVGTLMDCPTCVPRAESMVSVVFDTGSTNIWISSDLCAAGPCTRSGRVRYNHLRSLTYRAPDSLLELSVRFGTGQVSGPHAIDDFRIGPFVVPSQTFAMIEKQEGAVFEEVPFEGILGLAFPAMSANKVQPFFDTVIKSKRLEHNEFAVYFNKNLRAGNAIMWGGVDPALYSGQIEYFPVTDPFYWAVDLLCFKVGDRVLLGDRCDAAPLRSHIMDGQSFVEASSESSAQTKELPRRRSPRAIVDTGTTYFTAEDDVFDELMRLLPRANCDSITDETHPPISYVMANVADEPSVFKFSAREFMTGPHGADRDCSPAFMRINVPHDHGPGMVLGELFLRSYYAVFDRGDGATNHAKVGFAASRHDKHAIHRLKELTKGDGSVADDLADA